MVYAEFARLYNAANAVITCLHRQPERFGPERRQGADPRSLMIGMNHTF